MARKKITNFVLLSLEKAIDGYVRLEDFTYNPGFYAYYSGWQYPLKKSDLAQALKRLREKGLVELTDEQETIYRLTDSGRDRALWEKMKLKNEKWDGKWRVVIWDIPEKRRLARDILRYKLRQLGFERLQKSVWACKKNCTEELRYFVKSMGIEDWVMVLESGDIGR